jgi:hypothetical protein
MINVVTEEIIEDVTSTTGSTGGFLKYPSVKVQPR